MVKLTKGRSVIWVFLALAFLYASLLTSAAPTGLLASANAQETANAPETGSSRAGESPAVLESPAFPESPASETSEPEKYSDWQVVGPSGGDVRSVAIDPRDKNRLYISTLDGQIHTS